MLRIYYLIITVASLAIVLTSYFWWWLMLLIGRESGSWFGNAALNLLRIILLAKPLILIMCKFSEVKVLKFGEMRKYLPSRRNFSFGKLKNIIFTLVRAAAWLVMRYRRLLGITVFILAFTHGGIYIATRLKTWYGIASQRQSFRILAGYISLFSLFIGYITSNNLSIKLFKSKRIWIQKSAYLALLFVVLHLLFLNPGEYRSQLILLAIYIYLKLVEKNACRFVLTPPQPMN